MLKITPLRVVVGAVVAGVLALASAGLVLWALFAWFLPHYDRSDIVGVYVANYSSGTETLTLNADGTFLQEVVLKEPQDSTPITRTGTWTWDESEQRVSLRNCMALNDGHGDIRPTFRTDAGCSWPAEPEWWFFGRLLLGGRESTPRWEKVR